MPKNARLLAVDMHHFAAEFFEHHAAGHTAAAVHTVKNHSERLCANCSNINILEDSVNMHTRRASIMRSLAGLKRTAPVNASLFESIHDFFGDRRWRRKPVSIKALDAIPDDGVVASSDCQPAIRITLADHDAHGWCHCHADVDDIASGGHEPANGSGSKWRAADSTIKTDHHYGAGFASGGLQE